MGLALVFLAALLAFGVSTVGGAGLLLLPVLARVLPASNVPAALTVGPAVSTVSKLALFWRSIAWPVTRRFVPGAVPGVLLGGYLLKYLNPLYLEVVIGLFLLSNLRAALRPGKPTDELAAPQRASWLQLGVVGFPAGFLSGLTGAVGLLFNKFYFRYGLSRDEVIATRAANEVLPHGLKLALYFYLGLLTGPAWRTGAVAAVLATAGAKCLVNYCRRVYSSALATRRWYSAAALCWHRPGRPDPAAAGRGRHRRLRGGAAPAAVRAAHRDAPDLSPRQQARGGGGCGAGGGIMLVESCV